MPALHTSWDKTKLAVYTLLSGAGLVTIFPVLPKGLVGLLNNHFARVVILVMLLLQAGQPLGFAVIAAVFFYLLIIAWRRIEEKIGG